MVSWSASKEMATAQRAPPGQVAGARERPALARPTMLRHVGSGHCQGCIAGGVVGGAVMGGLCAGATALQLAPDSLARRVVL